MQADYLVQVNARWRVKVPFMPALACGLHLLHLLAGSIINGNGGGLIGAIKDEPSVCEKKS